MHMSKEAVETLGMTLAQTTLFSQTAMGEFGSACTYLPCTWPTFLFIWSKAFHHATHMSKVTIHQQSSADPAFTMQASNPGMVASEIQ